MTVEQVAELKKNMMLKLESLEKIVAILAELEEKSDDGSDAVDWVMEQLADN